MIRFSKMMHLPYKCTCQPKLDCWVCFKICHHRP